MMKNNIRYGEYIKYSPINYTKKNAACRNKLGENIYV